MACSPTLYLRAAVAMSPSVSASYALSRASCKTCMLEVLETDHGLCYFWPICWHVIPSGNGLIVHPVKRLFCLNSMTRLEMRSTYRYRLESNTSARSLKLLNLLMIERGSLLSMDALPNHPFPADGSLLAVLKKFAPNISLSKIPNASLARSLTTTCMHYNSLSYPQVCSDLKQSK